MAQPAFSFDRYDLDNNVQESVSNVITNISPVDTLFMSSIKREKSREIYKEWLIDELADAADNKRIDGDDFVGENLSRARRVGNYHQTSTKDLVVTRRAQIVAKYGRSDEMDYQITKAARALKRDINVGLQKRNFAVAGTATTEGESAGAAVWFRTNLSRGTNGMTPGLSANSNTEGYPNSVGTVGLRRALDESTILDLVRGCYDEGGMPTMIVCGTQLKQSISQYLMSNDSARVATQYQDQGMGSGKQPKNGFGTGISAMGSVGMYITDFCTLKIMPDRQTPINGSGTVGGELYIIDPTMFAISYLTRYKILQIAKTGDSTKRELLSDWTLVSMNEAASACFADVDTALPMVA